MIIDWHRFTKWHWRTEVGGRKLDYYPSKRKWFYKGEFHHGDVGAFIKNLETDGYSEEEKATEKEAWYSHCIIDDSLRLYIVHEGRSKSAAAPDVLKALQRAKVSYQKEVR